MVESDILDSIQISETRKIDNVFIMVDEEEPSSITKILFSIDKFYWIFQVDNEFDELKLIVEVRTDNFFEKFKINNGDGILLQDLTNFKDLMFLKGHLIGTMFAIINERGYTDGVKLRILNNNVFDSRVDSFYGLLTIISFGSRLRFDLSQNDISRCFV